MCKDTRRTRGLVSLIVVATIAVGLFFLPVYILPIEFLVYVALIEWG